MMKNKALPYIVGGVLAAILVAGAAVPGSGEQFMGMLRLRQSSPATNMGFRSAYVAPPIAPDPRGSGKATPPARSPVSAVRPPAPTPAPAPVPFSLINKVAIDTPPSILPAISEQLSKKKKEQINVTLYPVPGAKPGSARTRISGFNLSVFSGKVIFSSSNGNKIEVNIDGSVAAGPDSSSTAGPGVCYLTDGTTDYAVSSPGFGLKGFDFGMNPLTLDAPTKKILYVECDTTSLTGPSAYIFAQLLSSPTTIQWSDGTVANISDQLIVKKTLTGQTLAN